MSVGLFVGLMDRSGVNNSWEGEAVKGSQVNEKF